MAIETGTNSPTNYAGASGSVDASTSTPAVPALTGRGLILGALLLVAAGVAATHRLCARTPGTGLDPLT